MVKVHNPMLSKFINDKVQQETQKINPNIPLAPSALRLLGYLADQVMLEHLQFNLPETQKKSKQVLLNLEELQDPTTTENYPNTSLLHHLDPTPMVMEQRLTSFLKNYWTQYPAYPQPGDILSLHGNDSINGCKVEILEISEKLGSKFYYKDVDNDEEYGIDFLDPQMEISDLLEEEEMEVEGRLKLHSPPPVPATLPFSSPSLSDHPFSPLPFSSLPSTVHANQTPMDVVMIISASSPLSHHSLTYPCLRIFP